MRNFICHSIRSKNDFSSAYMANMVTSGKKIEVLSVFFFFFFCRVKIFFLLTCKTFYYKQKKYMHDKALQYNTRSLISM